MERLGRVADRRRRIAMVAAAALTMITATVGTMALTGGDTEKSGRQDARAAEQQRSRPGAGGGEESVGPVDESIEHAPESGGKAVNITIDDGPDPVWTPKVLRVLETNGVKATFCMVGPQAKAHPDLVKQVVAAGHRLCNHSMSHDTAMDRKPVSYQEKEILEAKKLIEDAAGGAKVRYYRAPGGAFTPESRRIAAKHGMRPLGWNVDTKDFELPGTAAIVQTVKTEISNGPTILFHDAGGPREQTVAALEQTLPWLKEQGYGFSFPKI
ncbi:polysaccharide deacetylase family protein [Streptomyces sp. SAJ15]|uniref:polysaccharide deacetylase family protein n=1 Tax=Streptomyces sp. SAJ15 TaxID=2011095 RepID=UPI0021B41108|nr:polysaccharide deacetylase family protein [Streptomyces sp. SAJ15]